MTSIKSMKSTINDLRKKDAATLTESLAKLAKDLSDVAHNVIKSKEKNVSKMKFLRRNIARVKTVLKEKEVLANV
ncbi:MAG: 50S ribosomal protein L29 [candidate division WWE3 bacterium GW2011_GWA1_46_21]|uniref:Large ribosomal subunit protein uL29 n=4 Tax=Katanobacteria TaxID=422282 RepID=A0A0G1RQE1_UNCKA|nr:MAG: 50S ribosomal protein L29 [candidate division WWE3 bacterium GW2011_GWA1_46_21]KKU48341.1 MAG: 50S ribosomal protein L29 [candidate division WWE3 bacterium GW2011_GWA2_46_9]KKU51339.1 MAG: 50S ribosomal protein L29 [candidate division WWE3 bacterium GW2011_GWC1_47_10]KKU58123.1 MAG: 50S ribosomal protein L29 [candidate division WWE3 bacterium GW2011_GWB1_47_11]